ncbi:MAG: hypothetical protein KAJ49_06000 [Arcobacteraceae bacterium]|nr:hypothetical protein [Arcobacteraceae bacterium]
MKDAEIRKFFKKWQMEFPNFKTPKLKKMMQKDKHIVTISAGQGVLDRKPMYATTPFQFYEGRLGGALGKPSVKGFKRLKGGKMFKEEVKAKMYAKKLMRGY